MPIEIGLNLLGIEGSHSAPASAPSYAASRLLVLQNPGKMSRYCLTGIIRAAANMGIEHRVLELGPVWQRKQQDIAGLTRDLTNMLRSERIGAVLGYVLNGALDAQCVMGPDGAPRSLFDALGIPHLMLWIDHPQWAAERVGLDPKLQPILRSPNNHHFVKSRPAADELRRVLGWTNCHALPVAEDPQLVQPARDVQPQYDLITIFGSPPQMDPKLEPFLDHDEPDVSAIMSTIGAGVRERLRALWRRDVQPSMHVAFDRFGDAWADLRQCDVRIAALRSIDELQTDHADTVAWLLNHPSTYFDAVEILWEYGRWQRTFYLRYLARFFSTAVLGADWTSVGLGGGTWIDHDNHAAAYAQGRVAINVSQGSDEEGLALKPFQIAAAGVPMAHIDRVGLADCFEPDREVAVFDSPAHAREVIADLLADDDKRTAMAEAARRRLIRDHTWESRLAQMLTAAGLKLDSFRAKCPMPA